MRDNVLIRKKANITMLLAKELKITPEQAIGVLYKSEANRLLSDPKYGFHLMSNKSIVRDLLAEAQKIEGLQRPATAGLV